MSLLSRILRQLLVCICLAISLNISATVTDVYVYNTEFSINPPGEPVEAAVITEGDTIRWVWLQGDHTTTSVSGIGESWNVPINSSNLEFLYEFNTAGVYWYYCEPHGSDNGNQTASGMASTITVLSADLGACCLPDASCEVVTEAICLGQGGTFNGAGSTCELSNCVATFQLAAYKDNILYETIDGSISNALGNHLYVGRNNGGIKRSVVAFDLSFIPEYAVVQDVQLQMYCNSSTGVAYGISLQRLNEDWGEGSSQASGNESNGDASTTNDATWIHTFYNSSFWSTQGGSFEALTSSTTQINTQNTPYIWNSADMISDAQLWVNSSASNFGWILRGDETTPDNIKRFASRHTGTASERPQLTIQYSLPDTGACCYPDASCGISSEALCIAAGGTYQGNNTTCQDASCGPQLTPFLDALPLPEIAIPDSGNAGGKAHYSISITEQYQQLHSELPLTRVWGYNNSYPGPTIEAYRDSLITVDYLNDLRVVETGLLRTEHPLTVDTCLHGPDSTKQTPVTVVHLHGGKLAPESDGDPEAAFPPGSSSGTYYYPNIQRSGTLWYHDHAMGITRLNVMMGLAGFYLLRDNDEAALNIPKGEYEIPLAIQDRSFNSDGSISYPDSWSDHFFGDVILVNGKVWPYLNVKQGKYRFRLLNGSNSRVYTLSLSNSATFEQIGTDLGLLDIPLSLSEITLLPGERSEIIVDFAAYSDGTEIILTNSAPAPFPGFPDVGVIPNVMKFIVQGEVGFTDLLPATLVPIEELLESNSVQERVFELIKVNGHNCGNPSQMMWTINGLMYDSITEFPTLGSTEIWTWHNESGISHPMHMHLVSFQILDRQAIDPVTHLPTGPKLPPEPRERGWKDTGNSPPGYRTRVITRFEGFTGAFPYHCHILEHEDHEMMRQYYVVETDECQDSTLTTTACDSFTFNEVEYTSSGVYQQSVTDPIIGCQNTWTLNLTINNSSTSDETITACDSYLWNATTYTNSGSYTFNTLNAVGCDSVATLNLTINNSNTGDTAATACESFNWYGTDYFASGTPTHTFTNAQGCDSVVTLNLTINQSSTSEETITACDSYFWNATTYTNSGTYTFNTLNADGCDSVATLNLTINNSNTGDTAATACESFNWYGTDYFASGTPTHTFTNAQGCDSVVTLNLTINQSSTSEETVTACDSYFWNATTYTSSGSYTFNTINAVGCDSVATLNLSINMVDTSVVVSDTSITANALVGTFQWLDCNNSYSTIPGETNQNFIPITNGNYAVEVTQNGCTDTSSCIMITIISIEENPLFIGVQIYPNPTEGQLTIDFGDLKNPSFKIYSINGQLITKKSNFNKRLYNLNLDYSTGIYFVEITSEGEKKAFRIEKQ